MAIELRTGVSYFPESGLKELIDWEDPFIQSIVIRKRIYRKGDMESSEKLRKICLFNRHEYAWGYDNEKADMDLVLEGLRNKRFHYVPDGPIWIPPTNLSLVSHYV